MDVLKSDKKKSECCDQLFVHAAKPATNDLTPWRKLFLQVLLFFQPVKNFFTVHGIGR